ncbi:MAG: T9SS type A sorting domain-containing protein [Flavobacteriales bacterium]|jgi:PKD repeat protein|nr:T9SS type A sorting domain-containing protein [Flavobacteriales bacterium]
MNRIATLLACIMLSAGAMAQQQTAFTCRTNDAGIMEQLHGNDPALMAAIAEEEAALEAWTEGFSEGARSTYTIPVVFHIIHQFGAENISDAQVFDAMRILNEDFNKQNPDWDNVVSQFLPLVANIDIEFKLARKDPNGNCTKGITRTVSALTNDGTQTMKNLIQWPRNKYLNVWVAASADGAAGYTLTPGGAAVFAAADGIVMQHTYVGSIGTGSVSRSRALTHEVGHWINLEHTWGGSNTPAVASNCNTDDGVSDTPNTIGWTTCVLSGTSCSSLDNVENYMEYSYCSKMFTNGQKTRMIAALNSSTAQRNQLITSNNLTATGVNLPEALCAAAFSSNTRVVCPGSTVDFTDESFNAVSSRNWSFAGGTPATSTDANPSVTYNTPGTYTVALTASDGSSSQTSTQTAYITVLNQPGEQPPVQEGFESLSAFNAPEWFIENVHGDNTWNVTTAAAYTGSKSARIVNAASMDGRADELVSRTYDMSGATQITVSYRYAYAKRAAANDDVLRFWTSSNCGQTWTLRKILRGSNSLPTAPNTTGSFVPNGPSQWGFAEVNTISSTSHVPNFRFKFEFESNGGNNIYLDDININGQPVSVEELASGADLQVLPNPADGAATALLSMRSASALTLEVIDMTGRAVLSIAGGNRSAGDHRIDLPIAGLQAGAYFLRARFGSEQRTIRFIVR